MRIYDKVLKNYEGSYDVTAFTQAKGTFKFEKLQTKSPHTCPTASCSCLI